MAVSDLVQELQLEVTCSICTKYMEVPVMLDCGHNYCEDCISRHWDRLEEEEEPRQCPLCRRCFQRRSFRQNKLLANVVEMVQRFPYQDKAQHVSSTSSSIMGKDPQGQQDGFRQRLEALKRDLEIVLSLPCDGEMREHLLHFLQDGQQMILQKLQEMEERNGTREDGEERKEEPDPEQQDENITLSRTVTLGNMQNLVDGSAAKGFPNCSGATDPILHSDHLSTESGSEKSSKSRSQSPEPYDCRLPLLNSVQRIQMMGYRVEVTLNPKTANPQLVLSNDRRSVRLGDERKDLLNCHERFDTAPCVLANEGFSFGRYYWEVDVWGADCWAVGVARKSVKRKGHLRLTPEHGIWTIEMHMGKYWALNTSLALVYCNERLHRVGIYLNYTEGQVAFYNAESLAHLYTFTTSFTEEIFPFFYTKDKMTPLVINRSEIEGWIPLTEQTQPSPAPII